MTRKQYRLIAEALRSSGATKLTVATLTNALQDDSPRFAWEAFVTACGYLPEDFTPAGGYFGSMYFVVR